MTTPTPMNGRRLFLILLALATWGLGSIAFTGLFAVGTSSIHEIQALLIGGFALLTGAVFFTGGVLAPPPDKR